ncbi:WD40-repeat-containing domain protein [Obelidium mucronatum]|nr:WD40-repeat-containing domain protein [Obelidium mucronatum]
MPKWALPNPFKKNPSSDPRLAPQRSPQPGHGPTPPHSPRVSLAASNSAATDARPSTAALSVDVDVDVDAIAPTGTPLAVPVVVVEARTTGTLEYFVDKYQLQTLSDRSRDVIIVISQLMTDWDPSDLNALLDQFEDREKSVGAYKDKIDLLLSKASNVHELATASTTVKDTMDTIVDGLGSVADTHPILKIAWFLVSAGYKMAKAGTDQADEFNKLSTRFLEGSKNIDRLMELKTKAIPLQTSQLLSKSIDSFISCLIDVADAYLDYFKAGPSGALSLFGGSTSKTLADLNERLNTTNDELRSVKQDGTLEVVVAVAEDVVEIKKGLEANNAKLDQVVTAVGQIATKSQDRDYHTLRELCRFTEIHSVGEINALSSKKHAGTRDWIIDQTLSAITDKNGKNIVWLNGAAGTGKSVIAGCVAKALKDKGVLAASFFCQHTNKLRDSVASMIQTLGYELASRYPGYRKELIKSLQDSKFRDSTHVPIRQQLEYFFINPFDACPAPPDCVIVLDALDELVDHKSVEEVLKVFKTLKTPIKLFITSRPDVATPLTGKTDFKIQYFDVGSKENLEDIRLFTHDRVNELVNSLASDDRIDADENAIANLVTKLSEAANGLFIWITLVLGNVCGVDRHLMKEEVTAEVIEDVWGESTSIESTKESLLRLEEAASMDLYSLYCQALWKAYKKDEAASDFKLTIGIILHAKVPLSIASLGSLVERYPVSTTISKKRVMNAHAALKSLIKSDDNEKLSFIHKTVPEYLVKIACHSKCESPIEACAEGASRHCCHNQAAGRFQIDSTFTSLNMALACLAILNSDGTGAEQPARSLFRNMGNLDALDKNPVWSVATILSEPLQYAVTYWSQHFADTFPKVSISDQDTLIQSLLLFSKTKLPYYLEALLLLGKLNNLFEAVATVTNCLSQVKSTESDYIKSIFRDLKFVAFNFRRFLVVNPLQVYEKPIVMVPQQTEYYKAYHTLGSGKLTLGQDLQWGELTLVGHKNGVNATAVSSDGKTVVSGSNDKTVKLWSVETGECIKTLVGHSDWVLSVAISSDGQTVVSGSRDNTVKLWSVETGECIKTLVGHSLNVASVAISSDRQTVVSGSWDKTVKLWSVETGECINTLVGHYAFVTSVAISSDGQTVVSGSLDIAVKFWSVETAECIKTLVSHSDPVYSVAISSDGQTVVSGSWEKTVKLWSVETGECIKTLVGHSHKVLSVAISSDGQTVVSGSKDKTVKLWSVETAECIKTLVGHSDHVNSVAISPDGQTVVSGSEEKTVKLWSVETGECIKTLVGHSNRVHSVVISSDGQTVMSGSWDKTVKLWSVETGECIKTLVGHSNQVYSVAISSDGQTVVSGSGDKTVKLWSVETGECIKTLVGHFLNVASVAISSDGQTVVSGSGDKTVKLWSVETGECIKTLVGHSKLLTSVAISSDGQTVVSGSEEKTVKLWSVETGECIKTLVGHSSYVYSVAISSDGQTVVSWSWDKTVKLWSLETGECIKTLDGDFHSSITIFGTQFGFKTSSLEHKNGSLDKQRLVLHGNEERFKSHKNVVFGRRGNIVYIYILSLSS